MAVDLDYVLTQSEDYEFYPEVIELAKALKVIVEDTDANADAINDKTALTSEEVARRLVRVAYKIDLSAADNTAAYSALANISDVLEEMTAKLQQAVLDAMDNILETVANRAEAYIRQPPGEAETAKMIFSDPVEQPQA